MCIFISWSMKVQCQAATALLLVKMFSKIIWQSGGGPDMCGLVDHWTRHWHHALWLIISRGCRSSGVRAEREIIPCFWLLGFDREKILIRVKTRITHFCWKTLRQVFIRRLTACRVLRDEKNCEKKGWDYEYFKILRNMNERYINDTKDVLTLNRIEGIHAVVPANWSFAIITSYI